MRGQGERRQATSGIPTDLLTRAFFADMTTDDSMSDDVFESEDVVALSTPASSLSASTAGGLNVLAGQSHRTPSPTGYRDYQPPPELFEMQSPQLEQVTHKVRGQGIVHGADNLGINLLEFDDIFLAVTFKDDISNPQLQTFKPPPCRERLKKKKKNRLEFFACVCKSAVPQRIRLTLPPSGVQRTTIWFSFAVNGAPKKRIKIFKVECQCHKKSDNTKFYALKFLGDTFNVKRNRLFHFIILKFCAHKILITPNTKKL